MQPTNSLLLINNMDFIFYYTFISEETHIESSRTHCHVCQASDKTMKCKLCLRIRYCGRECQKKDWKRHQIECKANRPQRDQ